METGKRGESVEVREKANYRVFFFFSFFFFIAVLVLKALKLNIVASYFVAPSSINESHD